MHVIVELCQRQKANFESEEDLRDPEEEQLALYDCVIGKARVTCNCNVAHVCIVIARKF
jgi:hypothetical protein